MTVSVAALQMNSLADVTANLKVAKRLIDQAASQGAGVALLPENFAFMGADEAAKLACMECEGKGPIQDFLSGLASRHKLWIVAGSVPMRVPDDPNRVFAANLVFDASGNCVARYDKIHLFDVEVERDGKLEKYQESKNIAPGIWRPTTVDTPAGKLGLSICYDLRFPELFRELIDQGASWLSVPAAFTARTGQAHWEPLLRARAIENQCYVVAPGQFGRHADGRSTWGHSMVVDSWGKVVSCQADGEAVVMADIDQSKISNARETFPALSHRRAP